MQYFFAKMNTIDIIIVKLDKQKTKGAFRKKQISETKYQI